MVSVAPVAWARCCGRRPLLIEVGRLESPTRQSLRGYIRAYIVRRYRTLRPEQGVFCKRLSVRYRANGSDSDSPCQYFSYSDVDGGMEAEEGTRADTRCGLLRVGRGRRFADYDRCEGS